MLCLSSSIYVFMLCMQWCKSHLKFRLTGIWHLLTGINPLFFIHPDNLHCKTAFIIQLQQMRPGGLTIWVWTWTKVTMMMPSIAKTIPCRYLILPMLGLQCPQFFLHVGILQIEPRMAAIQRGVVHLQRVHLLVIISHLAELFLFLLQGVLQSENTLHLLLHLLVFTLPVL